MGGYGSGRYGGGPTVESGLTLDVNRFLRQRNILPGRLVACSLTWSNTQTGERTASAETFQFSITAVYLKSTDPRRFKDEDENDVLRGEYHGHPYGELNLVVPLNKGAQLKGLQSWQGPAWTAPGPGSRHYPEVKGGAVIALFYLPAGRISYDFKAPS